MALPGARPKPVQLRVVDGTHRTTRHGTTDEARKGTEQAVAAFGVLTKPKYLKGHAAAAWKSYIEPASWLDRSREPAAIAFCELWAEFREAPSRFPGSKHSQMRAYMNELGLTDERNRPVEGAEKGDEFFDD